MNRRLFGAAFSKIRFDGEVNLILTMMSILLLGGVIHARVELELVKEREIALETSVHELAEENEKSQFLLKNYREMLLRQVRLSAVEIEKLKAFGLKDPVEDIRNDLMNRNELIPYEGVLGGEMKFSSARDIHVLSTKWVRAYFENGRVCGWMMLEYEISDGGSISWKVDDSYLCPGNNM